MLILVWCEHLLFNLSDRRNLRTFKFCIFVISMNYELKLQFVHLKQLNIYYLFNELVKSS